ncbi:ATP-binding protein [Nostocaceae cyanobacterium CENA369]|uniref:ATP-binding protein n=1 Tax=Dendronalium phyllosphericum CENA369 TaxID=1725256 RepID=A0A8J7I9J9_9NOST|nr:ATP-binding protein [Dendronalium phyllosphericum]MBH8577225.1 ATP-binding protein [Dendronalium phyllosphericum CENA369]
MSETNLVNANLEFQKSFDASLQPAEEVRRSPEVQAEVERIGKADTYFSLDRDTELFDWLDDQRDAKLCGYITSATGSGLLKACQLYRTQYVKRRGTLLEIPATVIYAEIEQHGTPTDLYCSILEEIGHPLTNVGTLRDLRSRVWGTLKGYSVKILIIGNADYLTLEAFNELIDIFMKLRLPIILVGTYYLGDNILERKSLRYVRVHDSFLESYEFPNLTKQEIIEVVDDWEETFLPKNRRLNLTQIDSAISYLEHKSKGLIEPLYDLLRKIAILKLDEPSFELNQHNLTRKFGRRKEPKIKSHRKG